jgi:putative SOS response-associated peptidase YedK
VQPEHYHWWLASDGLFQSVLNAPDKNELNWHPVSRALNNVRNEGPELLKNVE